MNAIDTGNQDPDKSLISEQDALTGERTYLYQHQLETREEARNKDHAKISVDG